MHIRELIAPAAVLLLGPLDKGRALAALARAAAAALGTDPEPILAAVAKREALGSTGIGNGIAIPHARLPAIGRPGGAMALLTPPVEYGAIDDRPVDLVVLLLLPEEPPQTQLVPLACVARHLRNPALVASLRAARSPEALYAAIDAAP